MHPLLQKILNKRGIEDITKLRIDEREEFERLKAMTDKLDILEKETITVEGIQNFCEGEKKRIEEEWHNSPETTFRKEIYLKVQHKIYDSLLKYIDSPKVGRENLINYLESLTK